MTKLSNYAITEGVSGGWQVSSDATDPSKEYLFCLRARDGGSFPITISVQDYEQPALSPSLNAYPIRGPFVNDGQVTPNNSTVYPEETLKNGYYYYQDGSLVFLDAPNYQVTSLSACLNPSVEIAITAPVVIPPVVIPPEPLPSISCSSSNNEVIFTVTESNTQTGNFKFEYELNGVIQSSPEFLSIQELYEALNNIDDFDVVMLENQPEET